MVPILIFIVSITVLLIASDKFVDSSEKVGLALGIPSFVVGVTIVAFGTSLPELATSIVSVYSGSSEVVIGNAVGSNITNILLVLGCAAVFGKGIEIKHDVMKSDMPMLYGSAFLLFFALQDFKLSVFECILFLVALVIFLISSLKSGSDDEFTKTKTNARDWLTIVIGAVLIYFSAKYTIESLEKLADMAKIPKHVIAITVVALGTSLPEVVVSLSAAKKGNHGMAVGNVLGSNIFNTYAVMAIPGLLGNLTIPESAMGFSVPFMVAVSVLFGIICLTKTISKWEGYMLIAFYIFFIGSMVNTHVT
ncbi:MAG: calcium/sodium antiporter [Saprospiraceae bacterium]|nr:calcium/sodium antiporter [Saprospiraceae bacterium]